MLESLVKPGMSDLLLKEVKFETIGDYMVISSPLMDDEEDLLSWTQDLATFTSETSVTQVAHQNLEPSEERADTSNGGARKRSGWDGEEEVAPKRMTRASTSTHHELTPVKPDPIVCAETSEDSAGDSSMQLWSGAGGLESIPPGFDSSLSGIPYNLNDSMLSPPPLSFKQEEELGLAMSQDDPGSNEGTLQRLLQGTNFAMPRPDTDCRFQYVLAAATSMASKQGEETLTYLNQGQSYGIKLKKVGELLAFKGKLLKSVLRVQFHERRLQYSEKEQILAWQASRPGERIVELDVPLSYGLCDVDHDTTMVNTLAFSWDPTQEVGAYIKVNAISTEFTPKKHGGEKGVPFRLQVETYIQGDTYRLHAAACQIRVFKLKGADRKHKQEREKGMKLPDNERSKYQPSYDSTVLTDLSPDAAVTAQPFVSNNADTQTFRQTTRQANVGNSRGGRNHVSHPSVPDAADLPAKLEEPTAAAVAPQPSPRQDDNLAQTQFTVEMTRDQVAAWMLLHGFEAVAATFSHYTGTDMFRLTRQDLISLCGAPQGTRLFYALRSKPAIRLTLYVALPGKTWYHPLYLTSATVAELLAKLAALQVPRGDIYLLGPNGIHVMVTDELIGNLNNEASLSLQSRKDERTGRSCILLRFTSPNTTAET